MAGRFKEIYTQHADMYEKMILHADYKRHLIPSIEHIQPLSDAIVIEFGAGTGHLTRQIAPLAKTVYAFDLNENMMAEGVRVLSNGSIQNWTAALGDNRAMPIQSNTADLAIEGWAFLHIAVWHPDNWREASGRAIDEMLRVTRTGGHVIILETLGTGKAKPTIPHELGKQFYGFLEHDYGFASTWIRSDFRFDSMEQAQEMMAFFFGDAAQNMPYMKEDDGVIVPECTGIWWRAV